MTKHLVDSRTRAGQREQRGHCYKKRGAHGVCACAYSKHIDPFLILFLILSYSSSYPFPFLILSYSLSYPFLISFIPYLILISLCMFAAVGSHLFVESGDSSNHHPIPRTTCHQSETSRVHRPD